MKLDIGGTALEVRGAERTLEGRLRERYGGFEAPACASPDIHLRLSVDPDARPTGYHPTWVDNPPLRSRGELSETITCHGEDFRGRFSPARRRGAARIPDSLAHADLSIRIALGLHLLAAGAGTLLHAAAVVRDGWALLFSGPSGAGKSTIARLLADAGMTVLADEMVVVRRTGAGVRAFGTPFWNGAPRSAPAGALFLIEQAHEHAVEQIPAAQALPMLLRAGGAPLDAPSVQRAFFDALGALLRRVPVYRLRFRKDAGFLRELDLLPEFAFWRPRRSIVRALPRAAAPSGTAG